MPSTGVPRHNTLLAEKTDQHLKKREGRRRHPYRPFRHDNLDRECSGEKIGPALGLFDPIHRPFVSGNKASQYRGWYHTKRFLLLFFCTSRRLSIIPDFDSDNEGVPDVVIANDATVQYFCAAKLSTRFLFFPAL